MRHISSHISFRVSHILQTPLRAYPRHHICVYIRVWVLSDIAHVLLRDAYAGKIKKNRKGRTVGKLKRKYERKGENKEITDNLNPQFT